MKLKPAIEFLLFVMWVTYAPLMFYNNILPNYWEEALSNFLSEGGSQPSNNQLPENSDQVEAVERDPGQDDARDHGVIAFLYLAFLALGLIVAYLMTFWDLRKATKEAQSANDSLTDLQDKYERELQAFPIVEAAEGDDFRQQKPTGAGV